ncbi:hypothetical protein C8Q80DRAFT_1090694 [Daedaleopsis nitida]|nr:hypothetical protein C8Q80DRAFT_1090694 [Daedaleopsis nitida]
MDVATVCLETLPRYILHRQHSTAPEQVRGTGPGRDAEHLPNWAPIEPNLYPRIIRSATVAYTMFVKNASSIDKDQLRPSLRSRVSALGATLRPRRHGQYPSAIVPSTPQSECSTLVDFPIDDYLIKQDEELDFETEETDYLDAENSAWANGKHTVRSPKNQKHTRASQRVLTTTLDAENCAWTTASHTAQVPAKSRARFFATARTEKAVSGIEPEYLDPEDRAWM